MGNRIRAPDSPSAMYMVVSVDEHRPRRVYRAVDMGALRLGCSYVPSKAAE